MISSGRSSRSVFGSTTSGVHYFPPCENPGCAQSAAISCPVCALVNYCSRTCLVAHCQEHDPACKTLIVVMEGGAENSSSSSASSGSPSPGISGCPNPAAIFSVPAEDPESPEYLTHLYDRIRHSSEDAAFAQLTKYVEKGHLLATLYMFTVIARGSMFGKSDTKKAREFIKEHIDILDAVGQDVDKFGSSICFIRGIYFDNIMSNHEVSFQQFLQAANMGHVSGMVSLGYAYAMGQGSPVDDALAVHWYRKAAEKGHGMAMSNLGGCFFFGVGATKDPEEGVRWYKRSANVGHAFGQFNYANCKYHGSGCVKNVKEAVKFYSYAAEQNFDGACTNLGIICNSEADNFAASFYWFSKGAELGNQDCMNGLGCCYHQGRGVAKNEDEAYRLWRITASQGSEWSIDRLHRASSIDYYMRRRGEHITDLTFSIPSQDAGAVVNPHYLYAYDEFVKIIETPQSQLKAGFQVASLLHLLESDISLVSLGKDIIKILLDSDH